MTANRPSPARRAILLVEPICRGSRLQWLAYAIGALVDRYAVTVITRPDYDSDHFRELIGPYLDRIRLVTTGVDLQGQWIRRLTHAEFTPYFQAIRQIDRQTSDDFDVLFMALDEYLLPFLRRSLSLRRLRHGRAIHAIKYRVQYFLEAKPSARSRALRFVTLAALRLARARLLVLDERLRAWPSGHLKVSHLPDPWAGDFSPRLAPQARRDAGSGENEFVALTIGRQDERKGLGLLLESLDLLWARVPNLVLQVVGPIDPAYQARFAQAMARHGGKCLRHHEAFVPERQLPHVFAAADVVLMPYSPRFHASSGVLARAAASGVPVVATDAGLVGHRVRTWGLGELFAAESATELVAAIERVHRAKAASPKPYPGLEAFAQACHLGSFESALRAALEGETP